MKNRAHYVPGQPQVRDGYLGHGTFAADGAQCFEAISLLKRTDAQSVPVLYIFK